MDVEWKKGPKKEKKKKQRKRKKTEGQHKETNPSSDSIANIGSKPPHLHTMTRPLRPHPLPSLISDRILSITQHHPSSSSSSSSSSYTVHNGQIDKRPFIRTRSWTNKKTSKNFFFFENCCFFLHRRPWHVGGAKLGRKVTWIRAAPVGRSRRAADWTVCRRAANWRPDRWRRTPPRTVDNDTRQKNKWESSASRNEKRIDAKMASDLQDAKPALWLVESTNESTRAELRSVRPTRRTRSELADWLVYSVQRERRKASSLIGRWPASASKDANQTRDLLSEPRLVSSDEERRQRSPSPSPLKIALEIALRTTLEPLISSALEKKRKTSTRNKNKTVEPRWKKKLGKTR